MNNDKYQKIEELSKEIAHLSSIEQILSWDLETFMPKDGGAARSEQSALLASIIHKKKTSSTYRKLLNEVIDIDSGEYRDDQLNENEKIIAYHWRKDFIQNTKLPSQFVEKFAKTTSEGVKKWEEARRKKSFDIFLPHLQKIIDLNIEKAEILGYQKHPYDALLDLYEPDMTVEQIDPLFTTLKEGLTDLLHKIGEKPQINSSPIEFKCSDANQLNLSKKIMKTMGLSEDFCRIDLSSHPFSTSPHQTDLRMTTRFDSNNFISNILTTLHEGGHSLYQRQLPEEYFGTALSEPISFGIHESQSRWWETLIGKSTYFSNLFYTEIKNEFPRELKNIDINTYYKAINRVTPSNIRVEADEVTYSLHIIIRYEIEKELISGDIKAVDIPKVWNEKMKKYLNITPASDDLGCLQDIHWSLGYFGYFPSYTLGNIYASCLFNQFKKDIPSYKKEIENGDLSFINKWLNENIHKHGKRYTAKELIEKVTKEEFTSTPYLSYLNEKYSDIYEF